MGPEMISDTLLLSEQSGSGSNGTRGKLHLLEQLIVSSKLRNPEAAPDECVHCIGTYTICAVACR